MPTPFYHISTALDLLEHPYLAEPVRSLLLEQRSAFLYGNVAPDVQVVSLQPREATHFFDVPLHPGDLPAWEKMLRRYPSLIPSSRMHSTHTAFLAGYVCHLQADWLWVQHIFEPIFGPHAQWQTIEQRIYLHNVLRSYLDRQALPALNHGLAQHLMAVYPDGWLPFVPDHYLVTWRDQLAAQLQPGAVIRTVEVFAERQGIPTHSFYSLLDSEERMEQEIFVRMSKTALQQFRQLLLWENLQVVSELVARQWALGGY